MNSRFDKVKKLARLSKSTTHQGEKDAARRQALKLMAKENGVDYDPDAPVEPRETFEKRYGAFVKGGMGLIVPIRTA